MHWKKGILLLIIASAFTLHAGGLDDPNGYKKNSSLQWRWAVSAIEKFAWNGKERVLDIGCGDGKITALISEEYSSAPVLGLDISKAMIDHASSHYPKKEFPQLLFQEGDIASLPFHNQFDLVTAFCSIHYVVEQENALRSIYESLIPGGMLLIVGPGRDHTSVANISEDLVKSDKWAQHFPSFRKQRAYFTKEEYTTLLKKSGFEPVYFDVTHDRVNFQNQTALIDWLRPIINYTSHLSDVLREEFLRDLASIMMQWALPSEGESIVLESTMFECLCRRAD